MSDITGINEEALNGLILEIGTYQDEISNIFNSMEDTVNNLSSCYKCQASLSYSRKFDSLKRNFPMVKKNLTTYVEDLVRAKDNTAKILTHTKNVIYEGISNISDVTRNLIE